MVLSGCSLGWYDGFMVLSRQGVMVSGWSLNMVVSQQGGLRVVFHQGGLSVVFYQGSQSSWWSLNRVVCHHDGLGVVFHQGGFSSWWSLNRVVCHHDGFSMVSLEGFQLFTVFHLPPCCSSVFHLDVAVNVCAFCRCSPSHLPTQFSLRRSNHGTGNSNAWSSTVSASTQRLLTPIGLACTG